jgi:hypothetical protein
MDKKSIQITRSYIKIRIIYIYNNLWLSYLRYVNDVAFKFKWKDVLLPAGRRLTFYENARARNILKVLNQKL